MRTKIAIIFCVFINFSKGFIPDMDKSIQTLIQSYGYLVETHYVMTKDGYILEIHRIPGMQGENIDNKKNPVLIMHGLLSCSADWVVTGPEISLAFLLVQNGYDVWLGNNRGNTFGKNHTHYLPTSYGFWSFSWHEFGIYDLPAMINYVLKNTQRTNLTFVCYSQGCTQFFVMGSLMPNYNEKIKFTAAIAPAAFTKHKNGLMLHMRHFILSTKAITDNLGYFEFLPAASFLRLIISYFCRKESGLQHFCIFLTYYTGGLGIDEIDPENLTKLYTYFPAGCSWKQIIHYSLNDDGNFTQFDYGPVKNMRLYNSSVPPEYPLENVKVPIAIFHGQNDFLTAPKDIAHLAKKLPNVIGKFLVTERQLNHFDFLYGKNIRRLVYNSLLKIMNDFKNKSNYQVFPLHGSSNK